MSALLALLLSRRGWLFGAGAALAALVAGGLLVHRWEAPARLKAQAEIAAAHAEAAQVRAGAAVQSAAAAAVEIARTREAVVTTRTGAAADVLLHTPAGAAPVPPDVLRDWAAAIDGLRDEVRAAHGPADSARGRAARAVPPA